MRILNNITVFIFLCLLSSTAFSAIPPPPVNQNIGIPDTSFNFFDASLCKDCHHASQNEEDPLNNAPVYQGFNPNRHHLSIGTPIDGKPEYPPFRDGDGDGLNDLTFTCFNCHLIKTNTITGETELEEIILFNYRNCLNCHARDAGKTTVHHATERAQEGNCFQCHGGIVRGIDINTLNGKRPDPNNIGQTLPVRIPTYKASLITPWRSNKPNGDSSKINSAGTSPGNCNFCHNTANGLSDGTDEPLTLSDGSTTTVKVFTNEQNHHNTGFFNEGKCNWCHNMDGENIEKQSSDIKVCQRCHDISTLHNIEFDGDGDGIVAFKEAPYFGHIGNNDNCWGCHGFSRELSNQSVGYNGASDVIIPTLTSLSQNIITSGTETLITLKGSSFTNQMTLGTTTLNWDSKVVLTNKEGDVTIIEPITQNETALEFILPETQPIGFYDVILQKSYQTSNPLGLIITPNISIVQSILYSPYGSLVILIGEGFMNLNGISPNKKNGFSLVDQNGNSPIALYVWQDNFVAALFAQNTQSVTLTNLFNTKKIPLEIY